jgi:hypothetical protein
MVLVGYYDGLPVELEDLDLEPLGVAGIVYRRPTCDLCVCFLFVYLLLVYYAQVVFTSSLLLLLVLRQRARILRTAVHASSLWLFCIAMLMTIVSTGTRCCVSRTTHYKKGAGAQQRLWWLRS